MRRVAVAALFAVAMACTSGAEPDLRVPHQGRALTVAAAASLTEAFETIAADFEREREGVTVRLSFGPSDGLAAQIQAGAPADVFASASPVWMDAIAKDPGVEDRHDFARNELVVVTPVDDPAGISSIGDLARPGVKLVLAAQGVPAGDYARQMLRNAGVASEALSNVVSNEEDVKGVIQKVILGEADAGIVYVTDVTTDVADQVREVPIPDDLNVVATYPIAVVMGADMAGLGRAFVGYVDGDEGQATLASFGFLPPE